MARINRNDHPRILQMVDGEKRRVADVAAEFGCTPANIYALVNKLRREAPAADPSADGKPVPAPAAPPKAAAPDNLLPLPGLFAASTAGDAGPAPAPPALPSAAPPAAQPEPSASTTAAERPDNVTDLRRAGRTGGVGASLARPGVALVMRTADGDENRNPFRSLDDLLSAIKPILRAAARSPDEVWFSIQSVDLASLDIDAA